MTSVRTHNKPTDILTLLGFNNANYNVQNDTCIKYKKVKPNFTPKIYSLSTNSAVIGTYPRIYIYGDKFLPNGITKVEFGNTNISITYLNSSTISFVIPEVTIPGLYNIVVKNNISLSARTVTGVSNGITSISNIVEFRIIE
jgi:hypothetical protein